LHESVRLLQATIAIATGKRPITISNTVTRALTNETNPVIVNGVMNYTYDAYGRRTGMNLTDGTVRAQAGYTYDTAGRIATVGDGGDTLSYAYAPGTGRVASTAWTTATGNNTAYTYDNYHRLTGIAVNNTLVYGYTLNDKDQRTAATLENGDNWAYTYDTLGQLTGALKKDSQDNTLNNMSYAFDLIGNRTSAVEDAANWTYASNLLNQYTQVNALVPTYDADGNMLTWNGWTYTWNGENRLASATNGNTRLEFDYDFLGRRIFKKVYANNTLTEHRKFAYNGYKLIAEFDALNSNALLANYLWQPEEVDVPLRATIDGDACYFVADGNKNIVALKDATGVTTDDYTYTPFGAVTASGATENPFRFSSEYYDVETGLVYYNYRYYSPVLGRWIKRDSIEEEGGVNLYNMAGNDTISKVDQNGLYICERKADQFVDTIAHPGGGDAGAMTRFLIKKVTWSTESVSLWSRQYKFFCSASCSIYVEYPKSITKQEYQNMRAHEETHVSIYNTYVGQGIGEVLTYNEKVLPCFNCVNATGAFLEMRLEMSLWQARYYNTSFDCNDYPVGPQRDYMCKEKEKAKKTLLGLVEKYENALNKMKVACE